MKIKSIITFYIISSLLIATLIFINLAMYLRLIRVKEQVLSDEFYLSKLSDTIDIYENEIKSKKDYIDETKKLLGDYYNTLEDYEKTIADLEQIKSYHDETIDDLSKEIRKYKSNIKICSEYKKTGIKDILKYFGYRESEIVEEFGLEEKLFEGINMQESNTNLIGYNYEELGLTFVFFDEQEDYLVLYIELDHNIDVDGMSARMNLNDIKFYLENSLNKPAEINQDYYGNYYFAYLIEETGYVVYFYSYDNSYGYSRAFVLRKTCSQ